MLLRGERMRSGRRDSKINRRNLSRDREISLTMRALVRAKWSKRGGRWMGVGATLRGGRSGNKNDKDVQRTCSCNL